MNRMIHKLALLLTLLMSAFGMNASPIDLRTAQEVAVKFMNANAKMPLRGNEDLQLVTTYNISRGDVAFYIFNTSNGFVIVSADDCATPILGYSDEGLFDLNDIPIQLQDYLQVFLEQIQFGIENHLEADEATARQWESVRTSGHLIEHRATTIVAPLITSKWGQSCRYNNYCPLEPYGHCGHALVGCVATAYSQILRYWGYPSIGKGTFTYTPPGYTTQTVDFGATTYDWAHMPNWLTETSTSTEIDAVALLMWHCGVAASMQYGASASGTSSIFVAPALLNYFDYSDDMSLVYRDDYSDEEWLTMMKNCLDLGRPIYYSGTGSAGGHAFVCDGYDSDDFLHFNWGWNGVYDGYFALDALKPGDWVFSGGNEAIINIHPKCVSGTTYQVSASVNPSGEGSVLGMGYYDCNTVCSLKAEPNAGYTFHSWTENGVLVSAEPTYSFNVTGNRNLVANFSEEGSVCNIVFDLYDTYEWFGWFGNYLSIDYGNGITEQLTLVNSTSASYSRSVITGSTIILNWIPVSNMNNYAFDISYDNGYPIYHGENPGSDFQFEFTVDCDAANAPRVISVDANPVEGGSVSGAGLYEYGDVCTVVASPSNGYFFANWTENGAVVSNDAAYSFVVMEDCALTAHFVTNENIVFADENVKALCVQNWDTNEDGELSYFEASMVTSLGEVFSYNTLITSFEELQYFIGLSWIDDNAFMFCSSLTGSLIMPNSITRIGCNAFLGCSGLTGSLTIPNAVSLIDNSAFEGCSGLTGVLSIPNSITSIGSWAFDGCSGFTGPLTIPNSVTSIGDWAFGECSGFTGPLTIPNSVTSIGDFAFYNCNGFTGALTIPNSITSIGDWAFKSCSGLTGSLTIPNSVTSIGEYAFYECYGFIGQLIIGSSVASIGEGAFSCCMGLNSVVVLPQQPPMIGTDVFDEDILIYVLCKSEETYQMADGWHSYPNLMGMCSSGTISVVADPEEGGRVSGGGFYGGGNYCIVLASPKEGYCFVKWTENGRVVSYDSNYSFIVTGESVLTAHFAREGNIVFADALVKARCVAHWDTNGDGELSYFEAAMVTDLGTVFMNNSNITSFDELQYFTGLTSIGSLAFYYCTSMTSIVLPNSLTTIESSAFWACWNLIAIDLPNSVSFIGGNAFYDCHKLTSITIPNSVTTIHANPFVYCTRLDRIIVEEGNLVYDSRDNCNAIIKTNNNELIVGCKNTFIPNSVISIGNYAFKNCSSLTSIHIPNSVVSIGEEAFSLCGLTSITIPGSVTAIRKEAFEYCINLASITVQAETPPSLGSNVFFNVNKSIPVYVPCASFEAYQNSGGWNEFTNILGTCPGAITVEVLPEEGGMVTGDGLYEGGDTCTLTATPNEGYLFLNWKKNGVVVSCNASYSFTVTDDADIEAVFMLLEGTLIGQGESTNTYLPSYSYYRYTLSQQIYTPNEVGTAGSITSISYFNAGDTETRTYNIYMVNADISAFDNDTDWITVSGTDLVYSGSVTMTQGYWTTIVLDTPFAYNGTSNLAIVIDDNTGNYTSSPHMACRVFSANGYQTIRVYSDDTNYDPYYPSSYSGTRYSVKNQIILGITTSQTFTKEINACTSDGGYYLLSFPTMEVSPEEVEHMLDNTYDLYAFDESQPKEWINYKAGTFNLEPGKGYLYANSNDVNLSLAGSPYNGNGEVTLCKTGDAETAGWNLVGNPFAERAYLDRDFYVMNNDGSGIVASERDYVEPMEGVFVIAEDNGETMTFSTTASAMCPRLVLNLNSGNSSGSATTVIDRAIVRFGEGTMLPKLQIMKNGSKLFIRQDGKDYAVVNSGNVGEMPVSFKAEANGTYTISISIQGVGFSYLHLIDTLTNSDIDLLSTTIYSFEATTTDKDERFKVVFAVEER